MKQEVETIPAFGDVYFADLRIDKCIQGGERPVVIVQNNRGNACSPTVEVLPLTSKTKKAAYLPTHVFVEASRENGLYKDSVVLAEQVVTINKERLISRIGRMGHDTLVTIGRARSIQAPFPTA